MNKQQKDEIIKEYQRSGNDVGSVEVQVALASARISELTEHLKLHKKDFSSRRGLIAINNRRRSLLDYLQRNDYERYITLIRKVGLRH
ncbi:MAG: 30S ribosomal protein S15 [Oligosphaeraceae bacterium]|jgi:small subunit ribosomal protein S15|nr:30S ribosomal protein S15 [Oligosphaeraceae bacterium]